MARAIRFALLTLCALAVLLASTDSALAQKKKKKKKKDKDETPAAEPAKPEEAEKPPVPPAALEEFKKGQEADKAGDLDKALSHYETAFELYQDPVLQLLIGEAHRKKGEQAMQGEGYEQAVTEFEKANEGYKKYLELAPTGAEAGNAQQRIEVLTQGIDNAKKALENQKVEEKKEAEQQAAATKAADDERRRQSDEASGTRVALDGLVVAGVDQDASAVARLMAGGLLGWGRFAFEGHLSFEGFLRVQNDKGVSGRSVTILDLGARYGFRSARFLGPFVSGGAGFGFFGGEPRERKLNGDMKTCGDFEGGDCAFAIDKNISTRLGLGWGFEASRATTVAVRVDAMMWLFSVDDEQTSPLQAGEVEKPQRSLAMMLGLEFLHWP